MPGSYLYSVLGILLVVVCMIMLAITNPRRRAVEAKEGEK